MKFLYGLVIVAALGCKKEKVAAHVDCKVATGGTVECTVAQSEGTSEIEVCWDFKVACASAGSLEAAHTCAKVKDGKSTTATVPTDKVKITGTCEGEMTASISNLTINGEVSK